MRVPDSLLQNKYMNQLNKSRSDMALIQTRLATQSKVNKPSDNPLSNSRIMRMQEQLGTISTYKTNVIYAKSILDESILSMNAMLNEVENVQQQLTQLNSAIVNDDLDTFADAIDASIEILVDLANSEFNGQYNFAGTESTTKPFNYDKLGKRVTANSEHIGNDRVVKISQSISQKINISGMELFQSVFSQSGNLDSSVGVGVSQLNSSTIYDPEGNEYSLSLSYTKTAANTYDLDYEIQDSDGNIVQNDTVSDLTFDQNTGEVSSIAGDTFKDIHIENSATGIDFVLDLSGFSEENNSANFLNRLNQKSDIFNTLINIRENLLNGEKPSEEQVGMVNDFHQHLLNKMSKAGGIINKLESTEEILINQEVEISEMLSFEKDVDIAQALMDLENAQYTLDISYRISSMILPSSLLDYM